jgi:hypothetical protein
MSHEDAIINNRFVFWPNEISTNDLVEQELLICSTPNGYGPLVGVFFELFQTYGWPLQTLPHGFLMTIDLAAPRCDYGG